MPLVHNKILCTATSCPVSVFSLVLLNVIASLYVSTNINENINEHLLGTYARLWIATIGWLGTRDGKVSKHVLQQMNCLCPLTSQGRACIVDHYLQISHCVLFVWASSLKSIYKTYAWFLWRTNSPPTYHWPHLPIIRNISRRRSSNNSLATHPGGSPRFLPLCSILPESFTFEAIWFYSTHSNWSEW